MLSFLSLGLSSIRWVSSETRNINSLLAHPCLSRERATDGQSDGQTQPLIESWLTTKIRAKQILKRYLVLFSRILPYCPLYLKIASLSTEVTAIGKKMFWCTQTFLFRCRANQHQSLIVILSMNSLLTTLLYFQMIHISRLDVHILDSC